MDKKDSISFVFKISDLWTNFLVSPYKFFKICFFKFSALIRIKDIITMKNNRINKKNISNRTIKVNLIIAIEK